MRNAHKTAVGKGEEKDNLGDLAMNRRIILKHMLKTGCELVG
jgi:hypothetical protein